MSGARTKLAITAGRAAGWASRATGRGAGAQISGRVMLALDPSLPSTIARRDRVTLVSATNGKTTTTHLLAAALEAAGQRVVSNTTGANLAAGVVATLARPHSPAIAVLEVDERVLPLVVDPLGAQLLVLGNLSRDQLDRYGEVRSVGDRWRHLTETHPGLPVVANASDPNVAWAASPARVTWVALPAGWRGDAATCPSCAALLDWGDDGHFACRACGFGRPDAPNRLEGNTLVLGDEKLTLDLALPGRWNLANAALAITAAVCHHGVDPTVAARAASAVTTVSGRYDVHHLADGRPARILLAKNPAGWTEVLEWLAARDTGVVLAVNAHIADGRDTSWLWDAPFELLGGRGVVAATGERATDVAVRLDYAGVECVVEPDPIRAAARVSGDDVHIAASYTQFTALTRQLARGLR